ncbi:MAG: iron-sulfur cluster assembly scaffold protein [Candidatus Bipolaricaulota bacterium]
MYSEKVMEHFNNPKNQRKMDNPDGVGKVGNAACGDVMWVYIQVSANGDEDEETLEDVSWQTFGCTAAIATSSMVTEMAKGATLQEALQITNQEVAEELGGLPPVKMHCSLLASDALSEAIYDYLTNQDREIPSELQKTHEKVQRDMEKVEETYPDYLEMEEKARHSE